MVTDAAVFDGKEVRCQLDRPWRRTLDCVGGVYDQSTSLRITSLMNGQSMKSIWTEHSRLMALEIRPSDTCPIPPLFFDLASPQPAEEGRMYSRSFQIQSSRHAATFENSGPAMQLPRLPKSYTRDEGPKYQVMHLSIGRTNVTDESSSRPPEALAYLALPPQTTYAARRLPKLPQIPNIQPVSTPAAGGRGRPIISPAWRSMPYLPYLPEHPSTPY